MIRSRVLIPSLEKIPDRMGFFRNNWLWGALALSVGLQVLVIYTPFLQNAFSTCSLSFKDWLVCIAVASTVVWARELSKIVVRLTKRLLV